MLAIKLPKGKTAKAYERAAEDLSKDIARVNSAHRAAATRWKNTDDDNLAFAEAATAFKHSAYITQKTQERESLLRKADACIRSTGDVYVDHAEWEIIKGHYG